MLLPSLSFFFFLYLYLFLNTFSVILSESITPMVPCNEFHSALHLPCRCGLNEQNATVINCNEAVFYDFPILPFRFYIQEYSQRNSGLQTLRNQLFTASDIRLTTLDFSENQIRRLTERTFEGIEDSLEVLNLANNLLGDNFNPTYASDEFKNLKELRELDLSSNYLVNIDEGLLSGCTQLKVLKLDKNRFTAVPTAALKGPESLQNLQLQDNQIKKLSNFDFSTVSKLLSLNLTNNLINVIETQSFSNMTRLVRVMLNRNRLSDLPSLVFTEVVNLVELDLSNNFFKKIPKDSFQSLTHLKFLNLGSNLIESISESELQSLESLEYFDISRNLIHEISPKTFISSSNLKGLDISVNRIQSLHEYSFEGLNQLEYLDLSDNQMRSWNRKALSTLESLKRFKVEYNRIENLDSDLLSSVQQLDELSLAHNSIFEIPSKSFVNFKKLKILNLSGNEMRSLELDALSGIEEFLEYLDVSFNDIEIFSSNLNFPILKYLNLESNRLKELHEDSFAFFPDLTVLSLRNNNLEELLLSPTLKNIISLDVSGNHLSILKANEILQNHPLLNEVNLSRNSLTELPSELFSNLPILENLDLSYNQISVIHVGAFSGLSRLKSIDLSHNRLTSYKDDFFINVNANDTDLLSLNLSFNELTYLYPESFAFHPQLTLLDFSHNQFSFFPSTFLKNLKHLTSLHLEYNSLKSIGNLDFSGFSHLRKLILSHNEIEFVSETAFINSSQLQEIDLSHNLIQNYEANTFEGFLRLILDSSFNALSTLPKGLFDRPKVLQLHSLDLSHNSFSAIPVDILQSQYVFLDTLKMSHNRISEIPSDANILVNIKEIDLSFNPLSEDSVNNVLNEPKTVRKLNMAGTSIKSIPKLETPFLISLNLSHNLIQELNEESLNRPSLEKLDLSHNQIYDLNEGAPWSTLKNLQVLDISGNPLKRISSHSFKNLESLKSLTISHLLQLNYFSSNAFETLTSLRHFKLQYIPKIHFLDVKALLAYFPFLESLEIEIKDEVLLTPLVSSYTHRLKKLSINGAKRLKQLGPEALKGFVSDSFELSLFETSLSFLPPSLFSSFPLSSSLLFDIPHNQFSFLDETFLAEITSRRHALQITGLNSNPLFCDCKIKALRLWLLYSSDSSVMCAGPPKLKGSLLSNLTENVLLCNESREYSTFRSSSPSSSSTNSYTEKSEPVIITGDDERRGSYSSSTRKPSFSSNDHHPIRGSLPKTSSSSSPLNMDALIIGIVGGVVAFITILIFIICVFRLRFANSAIRAGSLALRGKCTCLKPLTSIYGNGHLVSYPPSTPVTPSHSRALALSWGGGGGGGSMNSQKILHSNSSLIGGSNGFGTIGHHSYYSAGTVVSRSSHIHPHSVYPSNSFQSLYPNPPYYVTFPPDSDSEQMSVPR